MRATRPQKMTNEPFLQAAVRHFSSTQSTPRVVIFMQGDPAGAGHSAVRSGRGTSGISSRLTTERISSSLAQSSGEKRAMMRSMTSDI